MCYAKNFSLIAYGRIVKRYESNGVRPVTQKISWRLIHACRTRLCEDAVTKIADCFHSKKIAEFFMCVRDCWERISAFSEDSYTRNVNKWHEIWMI